MTVFPAPPLDQIPLKPGEFLMIDGFGIPQLTKLVKAHPGRVLAAASYVDGFGGFNELQQALAGTTVVCMSITVMNNKAHCGDVEPRALSNATWRNVFLPHNAIPIGGKPCGYTSASNIDALHAITPQPVWWWSAHYGAGAHLCGPHTCGLTSFPVHATQCWDQGPSGENVDVSVCAPGFIGVGTSTPQPPEGTVSIAVHTNENGHSEIVVHLQTGEVKNLYKVDPPQKGAPGWKRTNDGKFAWESLGNPGK
jgi:hypothetical protein